MNPNDYWNTKHQKYAQQDWITKPTIFATQAIKYFPSQAKILELGCGQAQDSIYFAQNGHTVFATDFSQTAIELANSKVPPDPKDKIIFQRLDLSQTLPFEPNQFDVVYSHLALHYFDSNRTQHLFDEIYQVLKPGGIFATLTNTMADPEVANSQKVEDEYFQNPEGLLKRFFTIQSMHKYTSKFTPLLLDDHGETHKDAIKTLIRFVGKKS